MTQQQIKIESLNDLCKFLDVTEEKLQEYFVLKETDSEITLFQKERYVSSKISFKLREIPGYCDEPAREKWKKVRHVPKTNASNVRLKGAENALNVAAPIEWIHPRELKPNPLNDKLYERREDPAFEKSIRDNGVLVAIVANEQKVILGGIRRWRAANRAGLEKVPIQIRSFKNESVAVVELNRYRQKTAEEIFNESELLKKSIEPNLAPRRREAIAEKVGVSSGQLHKIETIFTHKDKYPEIAEAVNKQKITVHRGYEKIREKERVVCDCCGVATFYAEDYKGAQVCPSCKPGLVSGEKKLPAKPKAEKPKLVKPPKVKESWKERKAHMTPQVSMMEEKIKVALATKGVSFESQKLFCLQQTIPDFWFPKQNLAVYIDGKVHLKRQDRDEVLRELLAKRHGVRVLSIPYSGVSNAEMDRVLGLVLEAVGHGDAEK